MDSKNFVEDYTKICQKDSKFWNCGRRPTFLAIGQEASTYVPRGYTGAKLTCHRRFLFVLYIITQQLTREDDRSWVCNCY